VALEDKHPGIFYCNIKKMLTEFVKKFGISEGFENVIEIKDSYFTIVEEIKEVFDKIGEKPVNAGKYLGKKNGYFIPSLFLLHWLAERTGQKVVVDGKAAWLFICGRDLFESGIKSKKKWEKNQLVLVLNEENECLGFGKIVEGRIYIKNLFDIGDFLRREEKK